MKLVTVFAEIALVIVLPVSCLAATWEVPGDAATIQGGIDLASPGDIVLVHPGTYTGAGNRDLDFGGKDIVLRSQSGSEVTIIDCERAGRGFYFHNGETSAAVLEGFTITLGDARSTYESGGGIYCYGSSPTIVDCVVTLNMASSGGGIACAQGASPTVTGCVFSDNNSTGSGGITCVEGSSPTFTSCSIVSNRAIAVGGGLGCFESSPLFINCTFSENSDAVGTIYCATGASPVMENTIIAFAEAGSGVYCDGTGSCTLTCCDVYGNEGGDWVGCIAGQYGVNGNISEDPLFCGEASNPNDAYSLDVSSPCAVRNSPCGQLIGARPAGCTEEIHTETTSWGRVKAVYK